MLLLGLSFLKFVVTLLYFDFSSQDKEAKSGKLEEKETQVGSDLEKQEGLEGKEEAAASADEESETDYSSAEENILTKAGRHQGWGVSDGVGAGHSGICL